MTDAQAERLSPREQEIAAAFSAGESYRQIADRLCIAPSTVRTHLATVYRKLGVSSKLELHKFLENGIGVSEVRDDRAVPHPDKPSIAVLPFINLSGDPEQDFFAEGIAEDIITALSRIKWFFVTARTSSFSYKGRAVDVKEIGSEMGVRYVLEGSVRRSGLRVRVIAQLIDTTDGNHVWGERYDREVSDIFDVQDEIVRSVVSSTQTQVQLAEGSLFADLERPSLPVWALVNRAWKFFYDMTSDSLLEARRLAEEAIVIDPKSGRAHQILASIYWHWAWMGFAEDREATLAEGRKFAERAVRLNEYDEYSHWTLGMYRMFEGHYDMAVAELERALDINPNCSLAFGSLGTVLNFAGQPERAIVNNEIAIRSNPRDPSIFYRHSGLALSHLLLGAYDDAIEWARKSVLFKPDWHQGHAYLIAALVRLRRMPEARAALTDYRRKSPTASLKDIRELPFRRTEHRQFLIDALREAGLPD